MSIKIHAFPLSPRGFKALAVAEHLGADYEFVFCDLFKGAQHHPAFVAMNPNKKMPVLEDGELKLWESNAIIQYLAERSPSGGLLPADARERADVARWLFWESTTWDPAFVILLWENMVKGAVRGEGPDPSEVAKGMEKFNAAASILNDHLANRSFICGDRLSLADFSIGSALSAMAQAKVSLEAYPNIARWYATLEALPAWGRVRAMQSQPSN